MLPEGFYSKLDTHKQPLDKLDKFRVALAIFKYYQIKNFLDIGCGRGDFALRVAQSNKLPEVYGVDISSKLTAIARKQGVIASRHNIDKKNLPFKADSFDGIFCGEVIEHLYDPDHLLTEIRRLLSEKGVCVLTTPNLSSWYNRIALLLGYQPFFAESSTKHSVGQMFPLGAGSGHIRVGTYRALVNLFAIYNFKIVKVFGFGVNEKLGLGKKYRIIIKPINFLLKKFPSISSDLMFVLKKVICLAEK